MLTLAKVTSPPVSEKHHSDCLVWDDHKLWQSSRLKWWEKLRNWEKLSNTRVGGPCWSLDLPSNLFHKEPKNNKGSQNQRNKRFLERNLNQKHPVNSPLSNFCECVGEGGGGNQIKEVWFRLHTKELKLVWLSFGDQKNTMSSKPNWESIYE